MSLEKWESRVKDIVFNCSELKNLSRGIILFGSLQMKKGMRPSAPSQTLLFPTNPCSTVTAYKLHLSATIYPSANTITFHQANVKVIIKPTLCSPAESCYCPSVCNVHDTARPSLFQFVSESYIQSRKTCFMGFDDSLQAVWTKVLMDINVSGAWLIMNSWMTNWFTIKIWVRWTVLLLFKL